MKIFIAIALTLIAGCAPPEKKTTTTTGDILVGEFGSMTGPEATFGVSTHNGIVMAVDEINAAGGVRGRKIRIISEDDQSKPEEAAVAVQKLVGINFHSNVPTYWMIVLAYLSFQYYARFRDRELRASQLETRLSEARLDALKMQLRPHFLFNTLNSISSLMYSDVEAADTMITRLGDFLRLTIESDHEQLIPLRQELEFVRRYLDIEQIRFEDRLRTAYDVEPRLLDALVPSLVLQPLVENAIHHAIAPREEGGRIAVRASESGGRLTLIVDDDGPGLRAQSPERVRVGLGTTRARLEQLYSDRHELRFADSAEGGLEVAVVIPLQFRERSP